jgi:uncharacterized iron-regulated membrane protein
MQIRALWRKLHLWLGLLAGIPLCVCAVTGSAIVFEHELDGLIRPAPPGLSATGPVLPLDELFQRVRAQLPPGIDGLGIDVPDDRLASAWFTQPAASGTGSSRRERLAVDAVTGTILVRATGTQALWPVTAENLMPVIRAVHLRFAAGQTGRLLIGICAIVLLSSCISGLVVWWPRGGKWKVALTVKRGARGHRLHVDLHRVTGIYGAILLLMLSVTGLYFIFPQTMLATPSLFGARSPFPAWPVARAPDPGAERISAAEALQRATAAVGAVPVSLNWQKVGKTPHVYMVKLLPDPDDEADWRLVFLDPYRGDVLERRQPQSATTAADVYARWQLPLHSGTAFGLPGRLLVLAAGFALPGLFVTGVLIWNKRRRR